MNISEIAQKAGVSVATISRVINNNGYVKQETRERIQQIIKDEGYMPSAVAQSLSVQKTHNIGVISPDVSNPFFSSVLDGITHAAGIESYNVFVFNSDESPKEERKFLRVARQQRLDGIIISPVNANDEKTRKILEDYDKSGIPIIQFDRKLQNADLCSVLANNEEGTFIAVSRLIKEGHRKIGILEGDVLNWAVKERIMGYCKALIEADIPLRSEYMIQGDQRSEKAYEGTRKLMQLPDPPTAIFTCNNFMTLGCLRYLNEKNIELGKDISLIGFDDIEILNMLGIKVSVVDQSEYEMGCLAMDMLLRRLKTGACFKENVRVPVQLILRGSEQLNE